MPTTRTKQGKLPKKSYTIIEVDSDEEEIINTQTNDESVEMSIQEQTPQNSLAVNQSRQVFETFTSTEKLDMGLCIVRPLGGGKYELINLTQVNQEVFSSEETGLMIQDNEARLQAIGMSKEQWDLAKLKCDQAMKSANKSIFRFQKLPSELRLIIYGMVLLAAETISKPARRAPANNEFALMQTCKKIYAETKPIFYKNTFKFEDVRKYMKPALPALQENMTSMSWLWHGSNKIKDVTLLKFLATCNKLEVLTIVISKFLILHSGGGWRVPQKLHQNDDTIAPFRHNPGFDSIVSLRGLKVVKVDGEAILKHPVSISTSGIVMTEEKVKAFEDFLNRVLTQPKPIPEDKGKAKGKVASKAKLIPRGKGKVKLKPTLIPSPIARVSKRKRSIEDDDGAYRP